MTVDSFENWEKTTYQGVPFSSFQNMVDYNYSTMRENLLVSDTMMVFYRTGKLNWRRLILLAALSYFAEPEGFRASTEWLKHTLGYSDSDLVHEDLKWLSKKDLIGFRYEEENDIQWIGVNIKKIKRMNRKYAPLSAVDLIGSYESTEGADQDA